MTAKRMGALTALTLLTLAFAGAPAAWAGSGDAKYVGGTVADLREDSDGQLLTSDEELLVFVPDEGTRLEVPWRAVSELEYGQKVGRKLTMLYMSKKRRHFLTVTWSDARGKEQAAIFELPGKSARTTLTVVETRAGRKCLYQDEEAQKYRAQ